MAHKKYVFFTTLFGTHEKSMHRFLLDNRSPSLSLPLPHSISGRHIRCSPIGDRSMPPAVARVAAAVSPPTLYRSSTTTMMMQLQQSFFVQRRQQQRVS